MTYMNTLVYDRAYSFCQEVTALRSHHPLSVPGWTSHTDVKLASGFNIDLIVTEIFRVERVIYISLLILQAVKCSSNIWS